MDYSVLATILFLTHMILCSGCPFGDVPDCLFPCHCAGGAVCDPQSGSCSCSVSDDTTCGCDGGPEGLTPWQGPGCQVGNVAYRKSAEQSNNGAASGYSYIHVAGRSTDGNKDNVLEHGSCSFPQAQQGQRSWWRVDLLAAHTITRVIIHNRSLERRRLINTTVYVSLEATFNFDDRYICGTVQGYVNAMLMVSVDCQGPMAARYVTLIDDDVGEPMNFCEVEVIGHVYQPCNQTHYGAGCQSDCNCQSNCNDVTGHCPTQCVPGKQGIDCQQDCTPGTWGVQCMHTCSNCNGGGCNSLDGSCDAGCSQHYAGDTCDYRIATLQNSTFNIISRSGKYVRIEFEQWDRGHTHMGNRTVQFYKIEFHSKGNTMFWNNITGTILHKPGQVSQRVTFSMPAYNRTYEIRIVPYHKDAVYSGPGQASGIREVRTYYTDCIECELCFVYGGCDTTHSKIVSISVYILIGLTLLIVIATVIMFSYKCYHRHLEKTTMSDPVDCKVYRKITTIDRNYPNGSLQKSKEGLNRSEQGSNDGLGASAGSLYPEVF